MADEKNLEALENGFHRHLGDGVYASFDGDQIWLAANHHRNRVIALEPSVFKKLVSYEQDLTAEIFAQKMKGD